MVNRFEEGKVYRFTGSEAHRSWVPSMTVVLDGKPRKCTKHGRPTDLFYTDGGDAMFEGIEDSFSGTWGWGGNMVDWVEVDADGKDIFVEAGEVEVDEKTGGDSELDGFLGFLKMLSGLSDEEKPEEKEEPKEELSDGEKLLRFLTVCGGGSSPEIEQEEDNPDGFLEFLEMLSGLSDEEKEEPKEEPKEDSSAEDFMDFLRLLSGVTDDSRDCQECPEDSTTDLRFEVGKTYRYIGKKPHRRWNDRGMMDVVTDGKPRKCIVTMDDPLWNTGSTRANFEGVPENPRGFLVEGSDLSVWAWAGSMSLWEEVV